ncbi:MAG: RNA-binding transcriptional accessory protein [Acidobacteria bacterium]|nr:MAG: RNA-binding transcriptional accessory protein [Acidobacteriota bacterium]
MFIPEILLRISKEVGAPVSRVETTIKLLEEGGTVPFIARYRKEATGNLDEVKIRHIDVGRQYYGDLEARRATVLSSIEKQGKLTDDLKAKILACYSKHELEDLYLPYKPKRKTKASVALERGLEPLANYIWEQSGEQPAGEFAQQFVNPEKEVPTVESAIEGALHIIAERIAETPDIRKQLRDLMLHEGKIHAKVVAGKDTEKTKYEMYYNFEEAVPKIPSHRMLAIRRGTREGILTFSIDVENEKFVAGLVPQVIREPQSQFASLLESAARDAYERLLLPSIQNEVRSMLRERAESEAIEVFEENLRTLLLSPPAGQIAVMGIDPGQRTGCKIAVVNETGKFLENHTIHLTEPKQDLEGAEKILLDLVQRYNVRGIAIGNGTGSRETDTFVRSIVEKHTLDIFVVVVNEAGASVYSASKRAREEFPKLDVTVRGAISIARRLQDPLAELVKTEPKSIGVGQYQHDVDQKKLKRSLAAVVESCVNRVGVDLNSASVDLLKYVSGIGDKLALNVVAYRDQHGVFKSRPQLREVEGFGEKTFEQAAGFLRIKDGENPLDRTGVHPESYPLVERMASSLGTSVSELIENPAQINAIDFKAFEAEGGRYTVADIREELLKPGRDPRDKFVVPKFREDVKEIADLKEGMELEGTVTNVTNFGAFVDLGVHQDGLVHISELSHKYVQDARQAVKVGDIVKVKVIGVDPGMKRISLSMKAITPKPPRRPRPRKKPKAAAPAVAVPAVAQSETQARPVQGPPAKRPKPEQPPRKPRPPQPPQSQQQTRPPKPPVESVAPRPSQTMEEKIRMLQEKFGRAR